MKPGRVEGVRYEQFCLKGKLYMYIYIYVCNWMCYYKTPFVYIFMQRMVQYDIDKRIVIK